MQSSCWIVSERTSKLSSFRHRTCKARSLPSICVTPEEGPHSLVDLAAQARDLALGDALHSHRPHQVVDRAGRDALAVGFLDHGGQRLLGQATRFEEDREVAAAP